MNQALSRLVKAGQIRRLGRGLFDFPRINPRLGGELSPAPEFVAEAVARKRGGRITPSGAYAANALGLSTQVPAKVVYVTDASGGNVKVGKQIIAFRQVAAKRVAAKHKVSSTVFQALQYLGRDGVNDGVIKQLRANLSATEKKILLKESRYAVGWISDLVKQIAKE